MKGQKLVWLLAFVAAAVAACGNSTSSNSSPTNGQNQEAADPNARNGGTLNVGISQTQSSLLNASIVDSNPNAAAIDAPMAEGLLWYKSVNTTQAAKSIADFYQPWLATEVPTVTNGDVQTSGCPKATSPASGSAQSPAATTTPGTSAAPTVAPLSASGSASTSPSPSAGPAMCVTWKLRSGVQWHDGSKLSAHDVCATVNFWWLKYRNSNPTTLITTSGWDQIMGCQEKDSLTAVVSFKSTYGPYLSLLTGVYGVLPAHILDPVFKAGDVANDPSKSNLEAFKQPTDLTIGSRNPNAYKDPQGHDTLDSYADGTGPYVFSKLDSSTGNITLVKNNNYWNKDHQPHLDSIVFKTQGSLAAEVTAVQAGAIDVGFDLGLANLTNLQQKGAQANKFAVQTVPESAALHIDFNVCANAKGLCGSDVKGNKYLADHTIRQAILTGINRQEIVNTVAGGKATIPQDGWEYLGAGYAKDPSTNPQTQYSVAAANKLLDDAGYKLSAKCDNGTVRAFKDGTCINLNLGTTTDNNVRVQVESLVQGYLTQVGIKVNTPFTPNVDSSAFFPSSSGPGPLASHQFDMAIYDAGLSSPAEMDSYYSAYHADCGGSCPDDNQIPSDKNQKGQNTVGESNPALDKALDTGRKAINLEDQRTAAYRQALEILSKDLPSIALYQDQMVASYTTKLQGYRPNDITWDYNAYDWYCIGGNCQS